jgi:hypothetical protein
MNAKVHARWTRLFAQSEIPVATKTLAAGRAKECWDELTQDVILSAWDFDEVYGDDNSRNNGDDDAFINPEYGHDDPEKADLMVTTTAANRDDSNDDNEQTFVKWKMWLHANLHSAGMATPILVCISNVLFYECKKNVKTCKRLHFSASATSYILIKFGAIGFLSFHTLQGKVRGRSFQDSDKFVELVRELINFIRRIKPNAIFRNREDRLRTCIDLCGEHVD